MSAKRKQLSNSYSAGAGGVHFEERVQAAFVALMLSDGVVPCMPGWPIKQILLQAKHEGYDTDDLVVFLEKGPTQRAKILVQAKHSVSIAAKNPVFAEVITAAWHDYQNRELFTLGTDLLVLVTGPLTVVDLNTRRMLDLAQRQSEASGFFKMTKQGRNFGTKLQNKLQAFRSALDAANGGTPVSDEDVFGFLKHYRLLNFDLDFDASSVNLSLLHSLISRASSEQASSMWGKILNEVASFNQAFGVVTRETLSQEIRDAFKPRTQEVIPEALTRAIEPVAPLEWAQSEYARSMAQANLIGQWEEGRSGDQAAVVDITAESFHDWIAKIRAAANQNGSPVAIKNGMWAVTDRAVLWDDLKSWVFDEDLDRLQAAIPKVLTAPDPQFELPPDDRFAASVRGKVPTHSPSLKTGLAQTLALLGNRGSELDKTSRGRAEAAARIAIGATFKDADWVRWASLDHVTPVLAEASPDGLLSAVEHGLQQQPCPFDELFSQESNGITGRTYLSGILWGLETLAWDADFLVRTCSALGDLAARDPGGNWSNRPANSLTTILLPWLPQTMAPPDKRHVAVNTLLNEVPDVGWKLLLSLLPNQFQTSTGSRRPEWRSTIPEDWEKGVTQKEYFEEVTYYADLAVQVAGNDLARLKDLVDCLSSLPKSSFNALLVSLGARSILEASEAERLPLWTELVSFVGKHRRFSDAQWALDAATVAKIEEVADRLAPEAPSNLFRRLFSQRVTDLYEEAGNWQEQQTKLEGKRAEAIHGIIEADGIEAALEFADDVESPFNVGWALATAAPDEAYAVVLPALLTASSPNQVELCKGYVARRQSLEGWSWVDGLDRTGWSTEQEAIFLSYMPFEQSTWDRVPDWLGDHEGEYWKRTGTLLRDPDDHVWLAVDKLVKYGRPMAAIDCLGWVLHHKQPLDTRRAAEVLLAAVTTDESPNTMDVYHVQEVIKALQENEDTDSKDLFNIEWAYLELLERDQGSVPKTLEMALASDPAFFCEAIRAMYRPEGATEKEEEEDKRDSGVAQRVWRLLWNWRIPPGTQADGSFSGPDFEQWLKSVKAEAKSTGHLGVALTEAGQVLFYAPADPDGLWIHKAVAHALNARDAQDMRDGFSLQAHNSRGVVWVDPTGAPERRLAEQYSQKADEVENAGFGRFAAELRGLARSYAHEAERVIDEHKQESSEADSDSEE